MTTVVECRRLSTRFGLHWVHRDIDLRVERGEVLALVGGSGSGKTTLLRQIVGLLRPSAGCVELFGEQLGKHGRARDLALRQRFGMLFQGGALFSALNVFDNVAFPLRELRVLHEDEINLLVHLKLRQVELDGQHGRLMPAELSGGMIKRVALARALVLEPELLLLDEPTAGLDPERSAGFVALIQRLREQLGLTVVLVTHDVDTLTALVDRVAVLDGGRILTVGRLEDVIHLDHPFIAGFFRGRRPGLPSAGAI